jgi:hypothetical protein
MEWTTEEPGFDSRQGAEIILVITFSITALEYS